MKNPANVFPHIASEMNCAYPLEWLDVLITFTLNPAKNDVNAINYEQAETICGQLAVEEANLLIVIKKHMFSVIDESTTQLVIERYHSSLIALMDCCLENSSGGCGKKPMLQMVYKSAISTIDSILSHLEAHYYRYLRMDLRVPATYLSVTRRELNKKVSELKAKADFNQNLQSLKAIIFKSLYKFTSSSDLHYEITFRSVLYNKELVRRLGYIDWQSEQDEVFSQLNEVLWYMNFNSKSYINFLIEYIRENVKEAGGIKEQVKRLYFYSKASKQMHQSRVAILNPEYHGLEHVMQKWFESEISYKEEKIKLEGIVHESGPKAPPAKELKIKEEQKVLCDLSSDQIGLIIRAADQARILIAKSMTAVFRAIVPHLSSPYKESLSYDGMRSKSYVPEEIDKQKAIEALEKIIKNIKEY